MEILGVRIQNRLDELEISQRELAKRLNLNYNTVNGYVTNRRTPDCETIAHIAQCLGSSIDYLVGLSDIRVCSNDTMTKEENILINNYRSLDKTLQKIFLEISSSLLRVKNIGQK